MKLKIKRRIELKNRIDIKVTRIFRLIVERERGGRKIGDGKIIIIELRKRKAWRSFL